jgi:hypothetical protein
MWHYLNSEDMKLFKDKLPKELYWKLSHQCRKKVPMLKSVYNNIHKQYIHGN